MFCKNCGKKTEADAKFCKDCGTALAEPVPAEKPAAGAKTPAKPAQMPVAARVVVAILQIIVVVLLLYWVWYMYNCAVGNNQGNGDQMCRSFYGMMHNEYNPVPNPTRGPGPNPAPTCIPTGCGSGFWCSGSYYISGQKINVPGLCYPTHPGNVYSSWSGTCRQCP